MTLGGAHQPGEPAADLRRGLGEPADRAVRMADVYSTHAETLRRFCLGLTGGDAHRADDVVQEALLRAWRHPQVMQRTPAEVRAWLFRVSRNLVIDEWRTKRSRTEFSSAWPSDVPIVSDPSDSVLNSHLVLDALKKLSPDHRIAIVECYYRGGTIAEVAARLDVPPGTVKSRLHYGLEALRTHLRAAQVTAELSLT